MLHVLKLIFSPKDEREALRLNLGHGERVRRSRLSFQQKLHRHHHRSVPSSFFSRIWRAASGRVLIASSLTFSLRFDEYAGKTQRRHNGRGADFLDLILDPLFNKLFQLARKYLRLSSSVAFIFVLHPFARSICHLVHEYWKRRHIENVLPKGEHIERRK